LNPPRVAIVGAPNVGKSTLANQLFARAQSITADLPGTTRDWVGAEANLDGLIVTLLDTPGLRDTTDGIEHQAIQTSQRQIAAADLVVLVLDPTQPRDPGQTDLLARFGRDDRVLRVVNKSDRPALWKMNESAIATVATSGAGIDNLRRAIRACFQCDAIDESRPRCWTARQQDLLRAAATNPHRLREI
jgi:tRNA modification GTPase